MGAGTLGVTGLKSSFAHNLHPFTLTICNGEEKKRQALSPHKFLNPCLRFERKNAGERLPETNNNELRVKKLY